jgi:hypothetical protein
MMRLMTKMTGKGEEELRMEMKNELEEMEREVSAMKELLKAKPKGGKKKEPKEAKEPKAKKVAAPIKKKTKAIVCTN